MKFILDSTEILKLPYQKGQNPKYMSKMCDVVISTAQGGGQEAEMCINCGIGMATFKKYQKEYPEFAAAVEYARLVFVATLEAMMVAGAEGKIEKYSFKANEKLLEVAEEKYRKLSERNQNNTTVNINTINLSPEERTEKIKQISEKLKSFGIDYQQPSLLDTSEGIIVDGE